MAVSISHEERPDLLPPGSVPYNTSVLCRDPMVLLEAEFSNPEYKD
jgi:hypothetical protein